MYHNPLQRQTMQSVHMTCLYARRPYLWGTAGASHYSLKHALSNTLMSQPSVDSVIECLDQDLLLRSAYNLPLHRGLSNPHLHQVLYVWA